MSKRGMLTDKVQGIAKEFLGREIGIKELRLYPYLDYTMKNFQRIDPLKINSEEREIFIKLKNEGHMEGGMQGLAMTREFFDYINDVLWEAYVDVESD